MEKDPGRSDDQRRNGRVPVRAAPEPARGSARRARTDRQQGRMPDRRLRRLHRADRRPRGLLVPDARRRGAKARTSPPSRASRRAPSCIRLQQKFLENASLQCGICTPGFLMSAKALLDRNPNPTEAGDSLRAGGQSVPMHRLRQNCERGARRRQADIRSQGEGRTREAAAQTVTRREYHLWQHRPRPAISKLSAHVRFGTTALTR